MPTAVAKAANIDGALVTTLPPAAYMKADDVAFLFLIAANQMPESGTLAKVQLKKALLTQGLSC